MVKWAVRAGVVAWIGVASMAFGGAALAQPGAAVDPKAMTLFKEGKALMDKGDYGAACPKLEASLRVQRGLGTLYNLAECYERLGKTASAYSSFSDVATAAEVAGQDERAKAARERAMALQPKLSKLRIVVRSEAEAPDLVIERDRVVVSRVLWDKEVPVDPGSHTVTASATGRLTFAKTVDVTKPGQVVTVEVPALELAVFEPEEKPKGQVSTAPGRPSESPAAPVEERSGVPALVLGGVAVASLGAGIGMYLASGGIVSDAEAVTQQIKADEGTCKVEIGTPHALCGDLESKKTTIVMLDSFAFGAVLLSGVAMSAAVVYLLWPSPEARTATSGVRVRLAPVAGPGGGGAVVSGTF